MANVTSDDMDAKTRTTTICNFTLVYSNRAAIILDRCVDLLIVISNHAHR